MGSPSRSHANLKHCIYLMMTFEVGCWERCTLVCFKCSQLGIFQVSTSLYKSTTWSYGCLSFVFFSIMNSIFSIMKYLKCRLSKVTKIPLTRLVLFLVKILSLDSTNSSNVWRDDKFNNKRVLLGAWRGGFYTCAWPPIKKILIFIFDGICTCALQQRGNLQKK